MKTTRESVNTNLLWLITTLRTYLVDWRFSFVPTENEVYDVGVDREVMADLDRANVVSSTFIGGPRDVGPDGGQVFRHKVLLDIDYPAYLIDSSTPGHHHLYLDVPGGVRHDKYMELLKLLAECGIIERGYADVSIARGHSDLRLPWVSKDDQIVHDPGEDGVNPEPEPVAVIDTPFGPQEIF